MKATALGLRYRLGLWAAVMHSWHVCVQGSAMVGQSRAPPPVYVRRMYRRRRSEAATPLCADYALCLLRTALTLTRMPDVS